jgi:hypothetical protein
MTFDELMTTTIGNMLAPIIRRAVYPETTFNNEAQYAPGGWNYQPGTDISEKNLARPGFKEKHGKKPLDPRFRLSARLGILLALTHARNALMKEILADKESIADAKAHGQNIEDLVGP